MSPPRARRQIALPRLGCADRKTLLLGTALASTLLIGTLVTPALAVVGCPVAAHPLPGPIVIVNPADSIDCFNIFDRNNAADTAAIRLQTNGPGENIDLYNSGTLTSQNAGLTYGIRASTDGIGSRIDIVNRGDIAATSTANNAFGLIGLTFGPNSPITVQNSNIITATSTGLDAFGIYTYTGNPNSPMSIVNSGDLTANTTVRDARGISARANQANSPISIVNSGDIEATTSAANARGIHAETSGGNNAIDIVNSGDVETAAGTDVANGISARTSGGNSAIAIDNSGGIAAAAGGSFAYGINALAYNGNSTIAIVNSGGIKAAAGTDYAFGIYATTFAGNNAIAIVNSGGIAVAAGTDYALGIHAYASGGNSTIAIVNSGAIEAAAGGAYAYGINARAIGGNSSIDIVNSGDIAAAAGGLAYGIAAFTRGGNSPLNIVNNGAVTVTAALYAFGIFAATDGGNSPVSVVNSAAVNVTASGDAYGIVAFSVDSNSPVSIVNSAAVNVTAGEDAGGIFAISTGPNSPLSIVNSGDVNVTAGGEAGGIFAVSVGPDSPIAINNSGSVFGGTVAIFTYSLTSTTIVNSGSLSAGNDLAINAYGAGTGIFNTGRITGFVDLTDNDDVFFNQAGGVFATKRESNFGMGTDLFQNQSGGTVLAATNPNVAERSSIINLNRFENSGLVSLQDGREGDVFEISNTSPQALDLVFAASGNSTLAIDAFLGGAGSLADEFIVNGAITGQTRLLVNNTNFGPGVFNSTGIPVVFANGNVSPDAFFLSQPIDTGFFNYDLFFRPTGSGVFELRSFPGGGALLLPQLVTATHDIWHQTSSTWFDRSADLRVLLHGGAAPAAYDPTLNHAPGTVQGAAMTPAVWVRGGGAWLDRDKSDSVTAYGNTYRFNLDRDLEIIDFQMGLDLGHRGLFASDDILVFGLLGGFVGADLDYNRLVRNFDFSGGQVGGYATYLRGGLFVDTLLNAHLLEMETAALGFPSSLDATTLGLRTDTGYRFGSFSGGAFIEPLATLSVTWADIDGFSLGGNRVSFDDEANVRGRLGLRVGTSYGIWGTTTVEPFVIGSVWGHLSGDNQATLTSSGTTFRFEDSPEDVWGEVSLGVNFFNPSASTAVFAKLDVTFGDDVDGIGGKAGMRVSW
ncbi:MAG: autotransporter domain-containing protein [Methyloceanibacter sp.]